jgi:hypothetical protein
MRSDLAVEKRGIKLASLIYEDPDRVKEELLNLFRKHGGTHLEGAGSSGKGGRDRLPPSLKNVAEDLGVTPPTVRKWLVKLGIGTYPKLAKALGMPDERKEAEKETKKKKTG